MDSLDMGDGESIATHSGGTKDNFQQPWVCRKRIIDLDLAACRGSDAGDQLPNNMALALAKDNSNAHDLVASCTSGV